MVMEHWYNVALCQCGDAVLFWVKFRLSWEISDIETLTLLSPLFSWAVPGKVWKMERSHSVLFVSQGTKKASDKWLKPDWGWLCECWVLKFSGLSWDRWPDGDFCLLGSRRSLNDRRVTAWEEDKWHRRHVPACITGDQGQVLTVRVWTQLSPGCHKETRNKKMTHCNFPQQPAPLSMSVLYLFLSTLPFVPPSSDFTPKTSPSPLHICFHPLSSSMHNAPWESLESSEIQMCPAPENDSSSAVFYIEPPPPNRTCPRWLLLHSFPPCSALPPLPSWCTYSSCKRRICYKCSAISLLLLRELCCLYE